MRRILTGSIFTALLGVPLPALAAPPEEAPVEDDDDDLVLEDEDEMNAAPTEDAAAATTPTDTSFLDDDGSASAEVGIPGDGAAGAEGADGEPALSEEERRKLEEKDITVVQHQSFLNVFKDGEGKKKRRFELEPVVGLSVNDAFVRHWSAGLEANYWLTNRMAIGLTATAFFGQRTPAYERIRFQDGLLLTANRYLWEASVAYQYEPFYGKIAIFNRVLMHWEAYLQLGGGAIHTQWLPRFEAIHGNSEINKDENRCCNNHITGQVNLALGSRFYVPNLDFMSFNVGIRTWGFFDSYEPQNRGVDFDPNGGDGSGTDFDDPSLDDVDTAYERSKDQPLGERLAFNSVFFIGVSFYLPPTFQYSTGR